MSPAKKKGPQEVKLQQIGVQGMRDNLDPQSSQQELASLMQNCYPRIFIQKSAVVGRPGFELSEDDQKGSVGNRDVQLLIQYSKLDGTEKTIAFVGGQMYEYNWGSETWATVGTPGTDYPNVTSGKFYGVVFADKLIVNQNDGTNRPFSWDGTTFATLSNCPVTWGKPVVYYAKLFVIDYNVRNQIMWSEENDPTTGYDQGGFNNAWKLGQVDSDELFALYAVNDALYYFRERSTGQISGRVTTDFVSTGVREGISETVGCVAPDGLTGDADKVFFIDADARPHVIERGIGIAPQVEFWHNFSSTIDEIPLDEIDKAVAVNFSPLEQIWFWVPGPGQSIPSQVLVTGFSGGAIRAMAVYRGWTGLSMALVKDTGERPRLMHGSDDGYIYRWGNPNGSPSIWSDGLKAGTKAIQHVFISGFMGFDQEMEKVFNRVDLSLRLQDQLSGASIALETPYGSNALGINTVTGGVSLWGVMIWGTDKWGGSGAERHVSGGFRRYGRWCRVRVLHETLDEQFGLHGVSVTAYPIAPYPRAR